MAVALETVVKQLEDSGIVAGGKLKDFIPPKASPKDVDELMQELVKQKYLTSFQAQQVKVGKVRALILGNYTILDRIGAGGMGQVYKAQHRRMERVVAIKMLPVAMVKDAAAAARFQREVVAAARLNHANIVTAYDADQANGVYFLVMEYVDGQDLSALVKKNGPFPVAKAIDFILQAARGLEFAHSEGVVHRDIKPANLLLDKKGIVKILDMGLARVESLGAAQAELTGSGAVMGTVDYMSPEQAFNTKHADARADIYSLGCSLYYLIAGRATFGGETVVEKILAHRERAIPLLREVQGEIPEQVETLFKKMVAKTLEARYQTMTEVVADLERCQMALATATAVQSQPAAGQPRELLGANQPPVSATSPANSDRAVTEVGSPKSVTQPNLLASHAWYRIRNVLMGAGATGLIFVLCGVWFLVRDRDDKQLARIEASGGARVESPVERPNDGGGSSITTPASSSVAEEDPTVIPGLLPAPARFPGIRSWQLETHAPRSDASKIVYSPDGKWLACAMKTGELRIYDATTWKLHRIFPGWQGLRDLAWNRDSKRLAISNQGNPSFPVEVLNLDGTFGPKLPRSVESLDWSPTADVLALGVNNGVDLWNIDKPTELKSLKGHTSVVRHLAWSPDGKGLASGSDDRTVRLWGANGSVGPVLRGHTDIIVGLGWGNNDVIVSSSKDRSVRLWPADRELAPKVLAFSSVSPVALNATGSQWLAFVGGSTWALGPVDGSVEPKQIQVPRIGSVFAWSPDGKSIVGSMSNIGDLVVYSLASGESSYAHRHTLRQFNGLTWSPNGKELLAVSGSPSAGPMLWSEQGQPLPRWPTLANNTYNGCLGWRHDGSQFAAGISNDLSIYSRDHRPAVRCPIPAGTGSLNRLAWSPSDGRLAAVSNSGITRIWNNDGTSGPELKSQKDPLHSIDWSAQGKIVTASRSKVQIHNLDSASNEITSSEITLPQPQQATATAWSPDGKTLAIGDNQGWILFFDENAVQLGAVADSPNHGDVVALAWSPDGQRIVAARRPSNRGMMPASLRIVAREGKAATTLQGNTYASHISWSKAGRIAAATWPEYSVSVWSDKSGELQYTIVSLDDDRVERNVTFLPNGQPLYNETDVDLEATFVYVVERTPGRIELLTASEFAKLTAAPASQQQPKRSLDLLTDEQAEAAVIPGLLPWPTKLPGVHRWQFETISPRSNLTKIAYSPDGKSMACAIRSGELRIYDATTWKLQRIFPGRRSFTALAWSRDSRRLAYCERFNIVQILNLDGSTGPKISRHTDNLAWSPTTDSLAMVGSSGLDLWDVAGPAEVKPLKLYSGFLRNLAWSPNGKSIAVGSDDKLVRIFGIDGSVGPVLTGHTDGILAVCWGKNDVIVSLGRDRTLRFWPADRSVAPKVISNFTGLYSPLVMSPDGSQWAASIGANLCAVGAVDGTGELERFPLPNASISWSTDGKFIAGCLNTAGNLTVGNRATNQQTVVHKQTIRAMNGIAWSPNGKELLATPAGSSAGPIFWSEQGELLPRWETLKSGTYSIATWKPDNDFFAAGLGSDVRIFSRKNLLITTCSATAAVGSVNRISWSPAGDRLVAGYQHGAVRVWHRDGTLGLELKGHAKNFVHAVDWSAKDKIASAARSNVQIQSLGNEQPVELNYHSSNSVFAMAWNPDGTTLATGDNAGRILYCDEHARLLHEYVDDPAYGDLAALAWSPDGQSLVSTRFRPETQSGTAPLRIVSSVGKAERNLRGRTFATRVAWSSTGKIVALTSPENTLSVWDSASGDPLYTIVPLDDEKAGRSVTVAANGRVLQNAGADLDAEFVYLVERTPGQIELLKPSEFAKLIAK